MSADRDPAINFDLEAAWLRRFQSDAQSNLRAFALSLREALPEQVTLEEHRGLFERNGTINGVTIECGDHRYVLRLAKGRLQASIAMIVRGITLNTKMVEPAEWFKRLAEETRKASEQAKSLSRSINDFLGT